MATRFHALADRPLVRPLLQAGCPSNIARLVPAVVVDTIDGVPSSRARSDIGKEVLETVPPASTHNNAPPAVVSELRVVWVFAALDHRLPYRILACSRPASRYRLPVRDVLASLARPLPTPEPLRVGREDRAAVTPAQPHCLPGRARRSLNHRQQSEAFTREVDKPARAGAVCARPLPGVKAVAAWAAFAATVAAATPQGTPKRPGRPVVSVQYKQPPKALSGKIGECWHWCIIPQTRTIRALAA